MRRKEKKSRIAYNNKSQRRRKETGNELLSDDDTRFAYCLASALDSCFSCECNLRTTLVTRSPASSLPVWL